MEQCSTSVKRLSMELGGNAPAIVFPDADIEAAASHIAAVKFGNCGQICVAPNRIFVHEAVMPAFLKVFRERAEAVRTGYGRDGDYSMGPLIHRQARQRVLDLIADAVQQGARLEMGGAAVEGPGSFMQASILTGVKPDMKMYREEVFGPVAGIISFTDTEEVLQSANETDAGLVAYVFTKSDALIERFSTELNFGEVQVNGFKYAIYLPHGGFGQSGIGKDCSELALDDYLVTKRITTRIPQHA